MYLYWCRNAQARIITTKKQGGDERNRHDLSIRQMTLGIIAMVQGSQQIGTHAEPLL
jgi:hypothetical protein